MSTAPKNTDGTKPAVKRDWLSDRRIRLLLAVVGAIVA